MPKVKPKRHVPSIDMTAMVDVAFLLLTFFIMTTKFRAAEKVQVDTPYSTGDVKLKNDSTMVITVNDDGRVFISFGSPTVRGAIFDRMAMRHGAYFNRVTDKGRDFFSHTEQFGTSISEFGKWLGGKDPLVMEDYTHNGIPLGDDGRPNELLYWITEVRQFDAKNMKFAIKGDRETSMPTIEKVIHSLQEKKANKFFLITNMEAGAAPKGAEPSAPAAPAAAPGAPADPKPPGM